MKKKDWGLLDNYICYTYARIKEEQKIAFSNDGLHACWNTGLVNHRYKAIYCYMTRREKTERWVFKGFCIDGEDIGKVMASHIGTLPQRALYFKDGKILFEGDKSTLTVDMPHITEDHPSRLPEEWLTRALGKVAIKLENEDSSEYDKRIGDLIKKNEEASQYLDTIITQAVDISLMRCQWNYKTAIPFYNPNPKEKEEPIGWFLPICIKKDKKYEPFGALVATKQPSGRFQGQTIYKLNWAYRCARLVCRPDSDWLSPSVATTDDDNEEED